MEDDIEPGIDEAPEAETSEAETSEAEISEAEISEAEISEAEISEAEAPEAELPEFGAEPIEATGEPRVDNALRRLSELGDRPVSEHPPVFERVHASLVDVLGELRSAVDPQP